ncbi:unnamed protein product, partial [marine sediment metagenome]
MTVEYILHKELHWCRSGPVEGWKEDPDQLDWFFPPWNTETNKWDYRWKTWCGFLGDPMNHHDVEPSRVLDRQYIYDPAKFSNLDGSQWKVFRKNVNKWPARLPQGIGAYYVPIKDDAYNDQIEELLLKWTEDRVVEDPEVMIKFLLMGRNRFALVQAGRGVVGVNVVDENWKHLIYRFCLDNGEPFLQ